VRFSSMYVSEKPRHTVVLWCFYTSQACGKEQECIDLYKALEGTHPNPAIRRQAANLRFILEAPKLKLGPDERVSVPVLKGEAATRYSADEQSSGLVAILQVHHQ
jgi:hypothetical protein